jgi:hypothetical protein
VSSIWLYRLRIPRTDERKASPDRVGRHPQADCRGHPGGGVVVPLNPPKRGEAALRFLNIRRGRQGPGRPEKGPATAKCPSGKVALLTLAYRADILENVYTPLNDPRYG